MQFQGFFAIDIIHGLTWKYNELCAQRVSIKDVESTQKVTKNSFNNTESCDVGKY